MPSTKSTFARVYSTRRWGDDGGGSGPGSTLSESSGAARILFHIILSLNAQVVVDAACGAMVWQSKLLPQLFSANPTLRYIGLDAADTVVQANREQFHAYYPRIQFEHVELESVDIPPTDLIFSRDTMQHNSIKNVARILHQFVHSNASHILTTSYPNGSHYCNGPINRPISTGGFFCIDLARKPFGFQPSARFEEVAFDKKWLYLYNRERLAKELASAWPRLVK